MVTSADVAQILVKNNHAVGVKLADGREVAAKVVSSALHWRVMQVLSGCCSCRRQDAALDCTVGGAPAQVQPLVCKIRMLTQHLCKRVAHTSPRGTQAALLATS